MCSCSILTGTSTRSFSTKISRTAAPPKPRGRPMSTAKRSRFPVRRICPRSKDTVSSAGRPSPTRRLPMWSIPTGTRSRTIRCSMPYGTRAIPTCSTGTTSSSSITMQRTPRSSAAAGSIFRASMWSGTASICSRVTTTMPCMPCWTRRTGRSSSIPTATTGLTSSMKTMPSIRTPISFFSRRRSPSIRSRIPISMKMIRDRRSTARIRSAKRGTTSPSSRTARNSPS